MRLKVVVSLVTGLVFYALSDVLLWQRIFEEHGLKQFDPAYQTGHREILLGMIAVGVILLWDAGAWAVAWALAFYTLAWGGVADLLYYVLDGRAIPTALPWLDDNRLMPLKPVTDTTLLINCGIWVALWLVAVVVLPPVTQRLMRVARLHYCDVVSQRDHHDQRQHDPSPQRSL